MTTFFDWFAPSNALLRKATATAIWLLLSAAILDCGSASDAFVPLRPARSIPIDGVTFAFIGREALSQYGYEEIIQRAVDVGFLRYPNPEQTNTQNLVGQTLADAAQQAWPVFTRWAVAAALTSQVDSPAPGPADIVALGMLYVGLVHAGAVGVKVLASSSATATATPIPTATATTTTTSPPIAVPRRCLPCLPVPVGGTAYKYDSAAAGEKPHYGMANHTHHFRMNQSPPAKGCRCFWDRDFKHPTAEFSPLPGAVPYSPHGGGGIAP